MSRYATDSDGAHWAEIDDDGRVRVAAVAAALEPVATVQTVSGVLLPEDTEAIVSALQGARTALETP
ncbi:MAG: hypothetical protein KDB37_05585 [Ilumatobacter sp.]|nr:hypothetical protein [Ilumatobacter sp.]